MRDSSGDWLVVVSPHSDTIDIGLGVHLPISFDARTELAELAGVDMETHGVRDVANEFGPYALQFRVGWDSSEDRYEVDRLTIEPLEGWITPTGLREVRFSEAVAKAIWTVLGDGWDATQVDETSDDLEMRAARTYLVARAVRRNVLETVAERLGVSRSTANRLLAAARRRGLLDG